MGSWYIGKIYIKILQIKIITYNRGYKKVMRMKNYLPNLNILNKWNKFKTRKQLFKISKNTNAKVHHNFPFFSLVITD